MERPIETNERDDDFPIDAQDWRLEELATDEGMPERR